MKRSGGVLMHVTSLPSAFGIGDIGPMSLKFADIISESGQKYWQMLPVNPTGAGNSPYQPRSVFAGNPLLISPDVLKREKLVPELPEETGHQSSTNRVKFDSVIVSKERILKRAYEAFRRDGDKSEFNEFAATNSHWLDDYSLYTALKKENNDLPWYEWPKDVRDRETRALSEKRAKLERLIDQEEYTQFEFFRQWESLKEYCAGIGVSLVGDVSFYAAYDSCDVWADREIFKLRSDGRPLFVGGVPPDYFSETGQLWGNPVYDWEKLKSQNFRWWMQRLRQTLRLFDIVRLDHFRGFVACWEIPADAKTAEPGKWVDVPWESFFETVASDFHSMPFIAEDLGVITPDVKDAKMKLGLPGMDVLLFAFDGGTDNPYLPENHPRNSVVYTGTHDTDTVRGWFDDEATPEQKKRLFEYVGKELSSEQVTWELIHLAMESPANLSIIPVQDILSLGSEARMNRPSVSEGNWEWMADSIQLASDSFARLREITDACGRR
jgi:4-alpha-glucanotransferase